MSCSWDHKRINEATPEYHQHTVHQTTADKTSGYTIANDHTTKVALPKHASLSRNLDGVMPRPLQGPKAEQ